LAHHPFSRWAWLLGSFTVLAMHLWCLIHWCSKLSLVSNCKDESSSDTLHERSGLFSLSSLCTRSAIISVSFLGCCVHFSRFGKPCMFYFLRLNELCLPFTPWLLIPFHYQHKTVKCFSEFGHNFQGNPSFIVFNASWIWTTLSLPRCCSPFTKVLSIHFHFTQ
jgi:hypothetical protein